MTDIQHLWAYLAVDQDGNEGIVAGHIPLIGSTPLVTGKESNAQMLEKAVRRIVKDSGMTIRLVKFSTRSVEKVIEP